MSFAYDGQNYVINPSSFGSQQPQVFYTPQNSTQPKVLNSNSCQYSSSSASPPTPENKENKVTTNSSDKMASKKPLWSPGKPLSPKAQEMIKSGKGRPSDQPPFKWICLTCNRCLRDEWGLEQHIQTVHGARTFSCPHNCNKVFKRKDHLSMHIMTIHEGRKPCKTCKGTVTFKSKEELHQHKLEVHGSSSVQKSTSSKRPSYKCESCEFRTDKKEAMEEHKATCAHVQKPLVPAVPGPSITPSSEQCGWNFNSQYYPKHHVDHAHAITTNPIQNGLPTPPPVIASNAAPVASSYILPGSSQLNYYEAKTNISTHQDIIQEVMGHDMFKGLQDDILNDSLSGGNPSDSSIKALTPVEFQPTRMDGPNVHMNYSDNNMHSNQYDNNSSSFSTLTPLNNPDYINYDNLASTSNLDLNLCDMKSVGITY